MPRTAENLVGHELIGLFVEVVLSLDPGLTGKSGKVVGETKNLLVIESKTDAKEALGQRKTGSGEKVRASGAKEEKIPKMGSVFLFHLPTSGGLAKGAKGNEKEKNTASATEREKTEEKEKVRIEGWSIQGSPEERTKRLGKIQRAWRLPRQR